MPFGCVCVCSQDQKKYIVDYSFSTLRTSLFIFSLWLFIICFSSKINYIIKVTSVIYLIVNVMRIETYVTISNINYAKFFSEHFFVLGAKSRPHSRTHCTQHTLGLWSTVTMKNKLYYLNWALGKRLSYGWTDIPAHASIRNPIFSSRTCTKQAYPKLNDSKFLRYF